MKRSELRRRTPLNRGSSAELKRSRLSPMSAKKRQQRADDGRQVKAEGGAFHAAIIGERCVVCGKTAAEAQEAGTRHQAHHGVRQEVLKRLGLRALLWDARNAVCCCEEPCHRRHTGRIRRIRFAELPARVVGFAKQNGLLVQLEMEYPDA